MNGAILTVSIILVVLSVILTAFILLHKGKGGGLSDLFGGGMTTAMSGTSVAERNLNRITVIVGVVWLACIFTLLFLYKASA
ncbi:preprotein translocase subunit SecG [Propionimicrobium lymphophilum]|uniref:Protein-export membrane protein SecG n=1 Tax=Propionimicrobium lymphophilum ACS-093-V-SCH5 TaxID=883161 RepID=S2W2K8_9ACTN|nr:MULTISPECIES: preprotein translocase subunit SecG [Propionimicrobium]EPD33386.1 preprotein translocase, SecG subunit [Propionimicrobium lymphophilum ACS-093-V-SCH5]ETJ98241.1 preprotein translocase, SecG subunit [Propionimicrobium sp. BV2F7]MDK7709767.1 preprotein translocase subunit SecG [Propionimicrobium lymphophilum]MDK7733971.1 preprotein translocase subunit SecG [Propionimicrobium lymphophilum]